VGFPAIWRQLFLTRLVGTAKHASSISPAVQWGPTAWLGLVNRVVQMKSCHAAMELPVACAWASIALGLMKRNLNCAESAVWLSFRHGSVH
jgi:hypothetical protein